MHVDLLAFFVGPVLSFPLSGYCQVLLVLCTSPLEKFRDGLDKAPHSATEVFANGFRGSETCEPRKFCAIQEGEPIPAILR